MPPLDWRDIHNRTLPDTPDVDDALLALVVQRLRVALWITCGGRIPAPEPRVSATRRKYVDAHWPTLTAALRRHMDAGIVTHDTARALCASVSDGLDWTFASSLHRVVSGLAKAAR